MHVHTEAGWTIDKSDKAEHAKRVQLLREFIFGEEPLLPIEDLHVSAPLADGQGEDYVVSV